jgi:hypothetical protein
MDTQRFKIETPRNLESLGRLAHLDTPWIAQVYAQLMRNSSPKLPAAIDASLQNGYSITTVPPPPAGAERLKTASSGTTASVAMSKSL